jgi:Bacterial PH domain
MTTYRSKIGMEIMVPLLLILIWATIHAISSRDWPGLAVILLVSAFVAHLVFSIYYQVSEKHLVIKCSFLINTSIEIRSIKMIRDSGSILAAPAASLDRLEIKYSDNSSILISPNDKEAFIEHLLTVNPNIVVVRKKT